MRRSKLGAVLLGMAIVVTFAAAVPASSTTSGSSEYPADPRDAVVDSATEPVHEEQGEVTNDPAEDPAVESLQRDYDLSTSQAIKQMDAQVAAGRAARDLPPGLTEVFI